MTEWDMKLTRVPNRTSPMTSCITPTMKARVIASAIYCSLPGTANTLKEENITIEAAVVGPDTRCQDEPNNAAIMAGTMLVYSPYSGGIPAMAAKATPCGNTMAAPVSPAIMSACKDSFVWFFPHLRNGNKFFSRVRNFMPVTKRI